MKRARGELLLGRFSLIRPLGAGQMGEVWLAEDVLRTRRCAVKLAPADQPERVRALANEYRHLRPLEHPNIVRVYERLEDEELALLSMEYLPGPSYEALRRQPAGVVAASLLPVAEALEYAHERGLVHRDLRATHILCGEDGRPRLVDFGTSARWRGAASGPPRGFAGGSRRCMSPQQLAGEAPQPADDVYGFGALLYELIAGTPPLGPEPSDESIRERVPESLERLVPSVPHALAALVATTLDKDPERRPEDMGALLRELSRHVTAPPLAMAAEPPLAPPPVRVLPQLAATREPAARPDEAPSGAPSPLPRSTIALGALVFLGVYGLLVLGPGLPGGDPAPQVQASAGAPAAAASPSTPPPPSEVPTSPPDPLPPLEDFDRVLSEAIELQDVLERSAVGTWAPQDWAEVEDALDRADRELRDQNRRAAARAYQLASEQMRALQERLPEALEEQLELGAKALAARNQPTAVQAYRTATQIAPDDERAQSGLARARVIDALREQLQVAAQRERDGRLEGARSAFAEARQLDPQSEIARQGLSRLDAQLETLRYRESLKRGIERLQAQEYAAARSALQEALSLRPDSAEARSALAEIEQLTGTAAIQAERARARALESGERWSDAAAAYRKILKIDPQLAFAREGLDRSEGRSALDAQLAELIRDPRALYDAEVQERAQQALGAARKVRAPGPALREQIEQLSAALGEATTGVTVVLESDGETEVTLLPYGSLGRFERRELELLPGSYVLIGSRDGYRDVREELFVEPGSAPAPRSIQVRESLE